jgi:hypothetical protein
MSRRSCLCLGVVLAAGVVGCGRAPTPPAGTGAREAAQTYAEAIVRRDWARAYSALGEETRGRYTLGQFTRAAEGYRRHLGMEPTSVRIEACEENGREAVAHFAFIGRDAHRPRRFKDALVLRQGGGGWGVVLPSDFGHAPAPRP